MVDLSKLLESPYTALVVAIVLGALALSGRFTMTATHVLLAAAWAVVIIGLRGQPLPIMIGSGAMAGGFLILLGYWFSPDPIPAYSGVLYPKIHTILKGKTVATQTIEIGDSNAKLTLANSQQNTLFNFFDTSKPGFSR